MALTSHILASGPGWKVQDTVCISGPRDRRFEEQHAEVCLAAVTHGTFQYRTSGGSAVLAPGGVMLGNSGACFECGHDHSTGDRCLAFHFAPEMLETVVATIPGARTCSFAVPSLPPLAALLPLFAEVEAARDHADAAEWEEMALRVVGSVVATLTDSSKRKVRKPTGRDERRVSQAVRLIEMHSHENLTLQGLAREVATSPYHFLRTFRLTVGMTPHQYLLRTRLNRAAIRIRMSQDPISAIAFDAGFGDLSTFNRRFRRLMGCSPSTYRAQRSRIGLAWP
jgi:AraC-like DNA-binding protein